MKRKGFRGSKYNGRFQVVLWSIIIKQGRKKVRESNSRGIELKARRVALLFIFLLKLVGADFNGDGQVAGR